MPDFHLHFVFQMLVTIAVVLVLWQIKLAYCIDGIRYPKRDWLFSVRRASVFIEMIALCWGVAYGHSNGWAPWPPMLLFLVAFDVSVAAQIFIMRRDLKRLERLAAMSGRARVSR
jgi:hypothetical protein